VWLDVAGSLYRAIFPREIDMRNWTTWWELSADAKKLNYLEHEIGAIVELNSTR
jgi:hypothetical protein